MATPAGKTSQLDGEPTLLPCFAKAVSLFREFLRLPPNWDTYDADPISRVAISTATGLLGRVQQLFSSDEVGDRLRPRAAVPLANGGVQLEWCGSKAEIEVEIGPRGELGYLLIEGNGQKRRFSEAADVGFSEVERAIARVLLP